jgi:hypothetical protein
VGHVVSQYVKKKWPENMDKALLKTETQVYKFTDMRARAHTHTHTHTYVICVYTHTHTNAHTCTHGILEPILYHTRMLYLYIFMCMYILCM